MTFPLHVNTPTKRAVAHPPECPEVPDDRVEHDRNYWEEFDSRDAIEFAMEKFPRRGYDAHWCQCVGCKPK
jgi:hypothetical protein